MKKYISSIAMMLCVLMLNINAINAASFTGHDCCKNCKDDKCKEICQKYSEMTPEAQKSDEGKKIMEECKVKCKDAKCCDSKSSCEDMSKKGKKGSCCKKK